MKLPYKLQQFWLRRLMWKWCFDCWLNLQYPHIYLKSVNPYYDSSFEELDNRYWFWMYLNNFDGTFDETYEYE